MPTYEYQCNKCGHCFEAFQSMKDDPLTSCPVCRGTVKRLISAGAGLIFKGSGFYITDYKNKEKKSGDPGTRSSGSDSSSKTGDNHKNNKNKANESKISSNKNNKKDK